MGVKRVGVCIAAVQALIAAVGMAQEMQPAGGASKAHESQDRAAATRAFLGLGEVPDKAAVARGEPVYQQNCSFCHGAKARGATGPALITSEQVLADDHGEKLAPFLKSGRTERGMPAFSQLSERERIDLAEYLHQQVEDVANRGSYRLPEIVVGDAAKGESYVAAHCMRCHTEETFVHLASRFRSPDQLQRYWIWPMKVEDNLSAIHATVKTLDGMVISGRVAEISDFRITIISDDGQRHVVERVQGVDVRTTDPLKAHQEIVNSLKNQDMHNVTAYLERLR